MTPGVLVGAILGIALGQPPLHTLSPKKNIATFQTLVVLVDFDDAPGEAPIGYFKDMFFGDHEADSEYAYPFTTLATLYKQMSYGRFVIESPRILGWLRAPEDLTWYAAYTHAGPIGCYGLGSPSASGSGASQLVHFALQAAVDAGEDLLTYDNDGDGEPEGILIVHAGLGAEDTALSRGCSSGTGGGDLWSHKHEVDFEGKPVHYVVGPELGKRNPTPYVAVGVWAHEFGHLLGLPDLYAPQDTGMGAGVGCWDLMGAGSGPCTLLFPEANGHLPKTLSAWSREQLGWLAPSAITANACNITLPALLDEPVVFSVQPNADLPHDRFVIEYRRQSQTESGIPGNRVCVWHIDDQETESVPNAIPCIPSEDDCTHRHYAVSLVQPDGEYSLERYTSLMDGGDCLGENQRLSTENTGDLDPWAARSTAPWWVETGRLGEAAEISIVISPEEAGPPPAIISTPSAEAYRGEPWSYRPKLSTAADTLWSLEDAPAGMQIDSTTGVVSWRVPSSFPSSLTTFTLQAAHCGGRTQQEILLDIEDSTAAGCACNSGSKNAAVANLAFWIIIAMLLRRFSSTRV